MVQSTPKLLGRKDLILELCSIFAGLQSISDVRGIQPRFPHTADIRRYERTVRGFQLDFNAGKASRTTFRLSPAILLPGGLHFGLQLSKYHVGSSSPELRSSSSHPRMTAFIQLESIDAGADRKGKIGRGSQLTRAWHTTNPSLSYNISFPDDHDRDAEVVVGRSADFRLTHLFAHPTYRFPASPGIVRHFLVA